MEKKNQYQRDAFERMIGRQTFSGTQIVKLDLSALLALRMVMDDLPGEAGYGISRIVYINTC